MEPHTRSRTRVALDGVTIAVFLIALMVPLYGFFFDTPGPLEENRERYKPPVISSQRYVHAEFTKHYEMYLGDHIGYRDILLNWHRRIVYGVLDEPVTGQAWIGKDGWVFLNQSDPFRSSQKMPSIDARGDAWVEAFAERDAWFRARGIEYMVVLAPDKAAVYPEQLRGYPVRHPPPELATPVAEKLNARGVKCVNLLPTILSEKARHPEVLYYYKTDSHWTPDAGRVGYRAVAAAVRERFPEFRARPDSDYRFDRLSCGDLRRFAGIRDDVPLEFARLHVPTAAIEYGIRDDYFSAEQKSERIDKNPNRFSACPSATGPAMLFLHDSFGAFLLPFVWSDFRHASSISTYGVPVEAVRIEKPKLVIQLMVSRQLYSLTPKNPQDWKAKVP